jgi:hypothetical protein
MAFFDFDKKVQTLLIAGSLVSMTACGCGSNAVDPVPDVIDAVDPAPDMIDLSDPAGDVPDEDAFPEVVDPAPDVIDPPDDTGEDVEDDSEDTIEASLDGFSPKRFHGFLKTTLRHATGKDGAVSLRVLAHEAPSPPAFAWSASSGALEARGDTALWRPPAEPGVHAVQVTVRAGDRLSIETFKLTV